MRLFRVCALLLGLSAFAVVRPTSADAQSAGGGEQMPRFLLSSGGTRPPVVVEASAIAVLRRRVSLALENATLADALDAIAENGGIQLNYSRDLVPVRNRVRLKADDITVAAALTEVLLGTGIDVLIGPNRQVALVPHVKSVAVLQTGSIVGRVTDGKTGERIAGAEVWLEGTRWRSQTDGNGAYRLVDVDPGAYTLNARRIGYTKTGKSVTVVSGQELTADVTLQAVVTQLNELITTVTGEQRRAEMGHVVSVIKADSVVKEAPVTSLSELLNGRVPGLQVFTNSGQVGGKVQIQVRSPNSVNLTTEPLVIVDGVRYTTQPSGAGGPFRSEPTSRLNDLNPNDIESVEIVKGPSASTLYGTDAANGVIVVTTKRGQVGPSRWNAYAKGSQAELQLGNYPDMYWGWNSPPTAQTFSCPTRGVVEGWCQRDSVTILPNPFSDPALTLFRKTPRWEEGLNLSGGQAEFRYYFAGDFEQSTGPIQMPPALVDQLKAQRGVADLPEDQLKPNTATRSTLRSNITSAIGANAEIGLNVGYVRADTRTLSIFVPTRAVNTTPASPYGQSNGPDRALSQTSTEGTDRFVGGLSGRWRGRSWLQARGTVGLDIASTTRYSLARPGEGRTSNPQGLAGDDRARQFGASVDLGLTALARRGRLSFRSSVGGQYNRSLSNGVSTVGRNLPPGAETVAQAASQTISQTYNETVTLGGYVEESVGFNDRLFLTVAARGDGGSAFGRDFNAAVYPKFGASWIASDEPFFPRIVGLDELRLRYAFGASGQQPTSDMALPYIYPTAGAPIEGQSTTVYSIFGLGNADLRPERVREHEFGLDASALTGRVRLGLTWFSRRTVDMIVSQPLPTGYGTIYTNLGLVSGHGFEADLTTRLIESDALSWQVTLQHSLHRSKVIDLGDALDSRDINGGYAKGYPLGARFGYGEVAGYNDANGNGVIESGEVQILNESTYRGEALPPVTQTAVTTIGLFGQRLRLSALFERRRGFVQGGSAADGLCAAFRCRGAVDPTASLAQQARAVAIADYGVESTESGDFVRWREANIALDAPARLARAMRVRTASLSLQVRNIALWSKFNGSDPESASVSGYSGGSATNLPQGRTWTLRVDLGL